MLCHCYYERLLDQFTVVDSVLGPPDIRHRAMGVCGRPRKGLGRLGFQVGRVLAFTFAAKL